MGLTLLGHDTTYGGIPIITQLAEGIDWVFTKFNEGFDYAISLLDNFGGIFEGLYDIVTAPFRGLATVVFEVIDAVVSLWENFTWENFKGIIQNLSIVKRMFQFMTDPVGALKDALFGSSFLHVAESLNEDTMPALGSLAKEILKPIPGVESLQKAFSTAWDAFWGKDEKEEAGSESLSEAAAASPINTVQFNEGVLNSSDKYLNELVLLHKDQIAILSKILEKDDPNNKKMADAMEKISDNAAGSSDGQISTFRYSYGFGEKATQWWGK